MKRRVFFLMMLGWLMALGTAALGQASVGGPALYVERVDAGGRSGEVLFVRADGSLAAVPVPAALYPAGYPDTTGLRSGEQRRHGVEWGNEHLSKMSRRRTASQERQEQVGKCAHALSAVRPEVHA